MKNILIVEDESLVALEISHFIKELGYTACATASSAAKAMEIMLSCDVDLVLMDVCIKGDVDGIACAANIKNYKNIPIIYISAFSDDSTLERAIETNPTTYLIKPFNTKELEIAIKIALKRDRRQEDSNETDLFGDIILDEVFSYDSRNKDLIMSGELIHLTKQEKQLLDLLIRSKNQVISIYDLENELWPFKESNENTRRALVARLRSKLNYKFIETLHSIGYRIKI
ncbi:response regulator [bacterium]|nr:response regulator [bacterium]MBU1989757.1 response regulator [bacterium]